MRKQTTSEMRAATHAVIRRITELTKPDASEEEVVLTEIERLQAIQRTHPMLSPEWQSASETLQPLFAEMAKICRSKGEE